MKKFFLAFMAVATIAMVGCKKNSDDPVTPTPTPGGGGNDPKPEVEIPEISDPEEGYVTFVINIPAGTECNGIAFKGTVDGAAWTGANQYLDEEGPASVEDCIKFEAIEGYDNWYLATYKLGDEPWGDGTLLAGKICLIYTDDGNWQGQFDDWAVNDEYSTADNGKSGDGNIEIYGGGVVVLTIGGWQGSECLTPQNYNITVFVPEMCESFDIEVIGSFCDWDASKTVAMTNAEENKFTATIVATEGATWKVRGVGTWDIEIQQFNDDPEAEEPWGGVDNNKLGADLNVIVDYSDPETYRWKNCAE